MILSWRRVGVAITLVLAACTPEAELPSVMLDAIDTNPMNAPVRVRVATVEAKRLDREADITGIVSAYRKATVASEITGRVIKRQVEPGDEVTPGQVLVQLDSERVGIALRQAKADVASAAVDVADARQDAARGERLFERSAISKDALDDLAFAVQRAEAREIAAQARLAGAQRELRDAKVQAPFGGIAETVHVQEGDYLNPGTPIVTLTDFSKARVVCGVTAADAVVLAKGQRADVVFEAMGGRLLSGEIRSIGRLADASSGTYPVEIWLAGETAQALREGMVASVKFALPQGEAGPAIPRAALFRQNGAMYVFRVEEDIARLVGVNVGRGNSTHVAVTQGLALGDRVVVEGQFALRNGARVTAD